jgi:hypothetical protein
MSTCIQCPLGATSASGAISQEECKCVLEVWTALADGMCTCLPGYARDMHNMCSLCASGTFCPGGDVQAQLCSEHSDSHAGATELSDCLCKSGYSSPDCGLCSDCPAGQWKDARGSAECGFCPENTYSMSASMEARISSHLCSGKS